MAHLDEQAARAALSRIIEPELSRDLGALNMLKQVKVDGPLLQVTVELFSPAYLHKQKLEDEIRAAGLALGAAGVKVDFTANVVRRSNRPNEGGRLPAVKNIIAVAAGKGGVGKSTVSTNLALALARWGARVGLLDADVYGPSVPTMLGEPEVPSGQKVGNRLTPAIHHGIAVMSIGFFIDRDGAVVWRGPMVHKLLQQFIEDVDWGDLDYLIVDLPPGTGDAQLSLSQLIPITGTVIVTTPQEVAIIDVIKAVSMFQKVEVPVLGVIENMSYYVCPACGHNDEIFAHGGGRKLAEQIGVPFLGELPIDTKVRFGGDSGRPIVIGAPESDNAKLFMEIAARTAARIALLTAGQPVRPRGLVIR